jgi:NTP pyrophosphatase (non-canonical NTP hydrolase)
MFKLNPDSHEEALVILQEECAEVIVEVSKIRRFGIDSVHYKTGQSHKSMLEMEIGDVLAMVDILLAQQIISWENIELAKHAKKEKLKKWSNIYETQSQ